MSATTENHTGPASKMVGVTLLAEKIGLSPWQVRCHARAGRLPCYRVGAGRYRFDVAEVLAHLRQEIVPA